MCLSIPRRPGGSRRAEFDVSCDLDVQVPGHVRINGMLPTAVYGRPLARSTHSGPSRHLAGAPPGSHVPLAP